VTLPINQKEITEIALPPVPAEVISPFQSVDEVQIEEVLQAMTLDEKIGQCLLWKPNGTAVDEQAFQLAADGKIGGVLFRDMEVGRFVELTDSLRRLSNLPLFVATNE
jgi:hypothetical protein